MTQTENIAEIELVYKPSISNKPIISSPLDAYNVFLDFYPKDTLHLQEHFFVAYLNRFNRVLGVLHLSSGGITGTVADIRLIFGTALKAAASGIIISHNHPSGNLKPSERDKDVTKKIREAGDMLDIKLMDHWNIESLQKRYTLLLERFLQIWQFPDIVIDEEETETDEDFNIYNTPDPKNKKLDYFIFKDEKIITDEVSKMYYHVVKVIFDENPSAFSHPDLKILLGLSSNRNDLRTPYPLNSSYYIEANIDNNTKFKKLKTLLTKFNYEDELLINFSNKELDDLDSEIKDRAYWDDNAGKESMEILDECLKIINEFETRLNLNYTQSYVGLTNGIKRQNFAIFIPKQAFIRAEIHVSENESWYKNLKIQILQLIL